MERKTGSTASDSKGINREANNVNDQNVKGLGPSFDFLPPSISTDILLRLPMKSLLICRCVCKSWRSLISDPQFAEWHFKNSEVNLMIRTKDPKCVSRTLHLLEFELSKFASGHSSGGNPHMNRVKLDAKFKLPLCEAMVFCKSGETDTGDWRRRSEGHESCELKFDVVNSCNGFLCLCDTEERNPLLVCNPITGEFIRLPEVSKVERFRDLKVERFRYLIGFGFGYHPRTNEYKVIRVYNGIVHHDPRYCHDWRTTIAETNFSEIHTLGTGVWKSILKTPKLNGLNYPIYLDGALHWLCIDKGSIVSFNFESDMFESFLCPAMVYREYQMGILSLEKISMGELKGCIYICDFSCVGQMQLWVRVKESWIEVFDIDFDIPGIVPWPIGGFYKPIKFVKENTLLMYHSSNCLIYYECRNGGYKFFTFYGTRYPVEAFAHIPSLVSLKDAVKGDNVEVMNVNSGSSELKLVEEKEDLCLVHVHPDFAMTYSSDDGEY